MRVRSPAAVDETPLRIVSIGGGTGLSTVLHGLKRRIQPSVYGFDLDLTAVVTVTDDGGSSGRLRREFDVLPPGDIRNCMVALSEDEALLSRLFQYRFSQGRGLKGHSFGNLFLTALTDLTGDFGKAVQLSSEVLASYGRIYPCTAAKVALEATLDNGRVIKGETNISKSKSRIRRITLDPPDVNPMPEALRAIREAELITLGPGSLFTSVIPNLLVKGVSESIRRSKAIKAYFVNLMWQPGETIEFRASDHLQAIFDHAGSRIVDYVVVNTGAIKAPLRRRYAREQAKPVMNDIDTLERMGVKVVQADLVGRVGDKVRHDPEAVAGVVLRLARESRGGESNAATEVPAANTRSEAQASSRKAAEPVTNLKEE